MTLSLPVAPALPARPREAAGRWVALTLLLAAIAGLAGCGFLGVAPNRILSAAPVYLRQLAPGWPAWTIAGGLLLAALALLPPALPRHALALTGWTIALFAAVAGAGAAASVTIAALATPAARVSLGAAFWLTVLCAGLAISENLRRLRLPLVARVGFFVVIIAGLAALAARGWFHDLSLVREWENRRDAYAQAFSEHITLVAAALVVSIAVGAPLGIFASRRPRVSSRLFDTLNVFQTIPSIALFGLLIGPLTALATALPLLRAAGIGGIGFAPALIALVLYALLPVARSTDAAVRSVPASLLETATAMGMTPFEVLRHVTLPLAAPILLAGLRIVVVQLIALTVLAALIGAGGFGSFVFIGLGQTATDLMLLGALSAIGLALVADALLRVASAAALARVAS